VGPVRLWRRADRRGAQDRVVLRVVGVVAVGKTATPIPDLAGAGGRRARDRGTLIRARQGQRLGLDVAPRLLRPRRVRRLRLRVPATLNASSRARDRAVAAGSPKLLGRKRRGGPLQRRVRGDAALDMARQLGFTLGVALFVAVVGTSGHGREQLVAFKHG